jgi:DNA modification methylase
MSVMIDTITTCDVRTYIDMIDDHSINQIITSPPYYNLREYYDAELEIGAIGTFEDYVAELITIFNQCKRILKDDGTLWVVLGDAYAGSGKGAWNGSGTSKETYTAVPGSKQAKPRIPDNMKSKDMMGIPWTMALALRDDGWYLRRDIIWHIPNAKPESVKDRPVTEHQYVFMLSKNKHYYYNHENNKESTTDGNGYRNLRSVWEYNNANGQSIHTARFPVGLVQRCIQLGCPENGLIFDPFMGSGTTAIAAINEGCHYIGCDINPDFVDEANENIIKTRESKCSMTQISLH